MYKTKYKGICLNKEMFCKSTISTKLNIIFLAIATIIIGTHKTQADESITVPQLKEIGQQIKNVEEKLHNLTVHSEIRMEKNTNPKDPCGPWQQTPVYVSSTMWSDGQPGGKIRVDVQKQVLEGWVTDTEPGPYSERSFTDSFDGTTGRTIINSGGLLDKAVPIKKGDISNQRPQSLDDSWSFRYTGREFTTNFFKLNSQGTLLSDLFNLADDPNSKVTTCFEFTWEKLKGVECIKINTKGPENQNWSKKWWLDPNRGFALMRYEHTFILKDKTETLKKLIEVQELREVIEGVWWPIRATCITEPLRSGEAYTRMTYRASEVVANSSNFDESVFTVSFPKGYRVEDKITGKNYVVDANLALTPEPNNPPK